MKLPVYTAVPLTTRRFEIYPFVKLLEPPLEPTYTGLVASPNVPEKVNGVPTDTPSIYKTNEDPLVIFEKAIRNASPVVEVKARRIGGSTYQVPIEVSSFRATNLALRWIIQYSRKRVGRTMSIKLASEIIDTANDIGNTIKKKEETHKMADANKAFAHFRY